MRAKHPGLRGRWVLHGLLGLMGWMGLWSPLSASGIIGLYAPAPVLSPAHSELGISSPLVLISSSDYEFSFFPEVFLRMGLSNRWEIHVQAFPFWAPLVDAGAGLRYTLVAPSTPEGFALTVGLEYTYVFTPLIFTNLRIHSVHPALWFGTGKRYGGLEYTTSSVWIQNLDSNELAFGAGALTLYLGEIREKPGAHLYTEIALRLFQGMPLRDGWLVILGVAVSRLSPRGP